MNLFYEEPDFDRWLRFDRYPRKFLRRVFRGPRRPGGQERVFFNLRAGLQKLRVPVRINDYHYIQSHPDEVACIIGKPHLLEKLHWANPILFGAAVFSHPLDCPGLLAAFPNIRRILVPGEWMRTMCEPHWGEKVIAWPVGIDTERWAPTQIDQKDIDILLYDKVRWEHDRYFAALIEPIRNELAQRGLRTRSIRYGSYREEEFNELLNRSRGMVFLCEHETQGIAYQQALSCDVPILAWDRGGYWQDPAYFPHKVKFRPVSSVPYWDERCGLKFADLDVFANRLDQFVDGMQAGQFQPRQYIMENLTLEKCAQDYVEIWRSLTKLN